MKYLWLVLMLVLFFGGFTLLFTTWLSIWTAVSVIMILGAVGILGSGKTLNP